MMRFSDEITTKTHIRASVGAGSMLVLLDNPETPLIVHFSGSPLCRIKMLKYFREIKPNVFVNETYDEEASNLISFDVDVAMGNVLFKMND